MPGADLIKNSEKCEKSTSSPFSVSSVGFAFQPEHMKTSLEVRELLLLSFMRACADTWSTFWLQGADCWFYLRMEVSLFPNIHAGPDEVLSGICYPVNSVATWMDCPQRNFSCCITNTHFILLAVQVKHISGKPNCDLRWSGLCAAQSVPTFLWRSWKYRFPWKSRAGRDMRKLLPQWQLPSSTHWKPPAAQGVPGLQKHRGPTKPLASCIGN